MTFPTWCVVIFRVARCCLKGFIVICWILMCIWVANDWFLENRFHIGGLYKNCLLKNNFFSWFHQISLRGIILRISDSFIKNNDPLAWKPISLTPTLEMWYFPGNRLYNERNRTLFCKKGLKDNIKIKTKAVQRFGIDLLCFILWSNSQSQPFAGGFYNEKLRSLTQKNIWKITKYYLQINWKCKIKTWRKE